MVMKTLTGEQFDRIRTRAAEIEADQRRVKDMFKDLADMFWISETDAGIGNSSGSIRYNTDEYGSDDIRLTATTSSRDAVTGLHRLLRTSTPKFSVKCKNQGYADKIEKVLKRWWEACNELKSSTLESELALSGILFSDENLTVTAIDDLLAREDLPKVRRRRLEDLRKSTPVRFEVASPMVEYPVMGDLGKSEHLTVTEITGRELKETYGLQEVKDKMTYTLYDYWDLEYHCTWYNRTGGKASDYLIGGEHGLDDIPVFTAVADGTELFFEEERKRQPFLYGKWKSRMHQREDELLTSLFTSVFARGHGPLVVVDKSDPNFDNADIELIMRGMIRILAAPGKPQLADDKAFDNNLIGLQNMLTGMGERTTINSQTLGENIEPGTPYSGFALASQSGRLPLVPIQTATEKVIKDAACYALRYFKEQGMEWEGLKPNEILDDFELTVEMEVDLPQDKVRTAQFLAQLKQAGVPLSNEYLHNELQIKDSQQMTHDVMAEMAEQAAYEQNLPQLVQQLSQMMQMMRQGPPQEAGGAGGPMPGPGGAPPEGAYPAAPGGPEMVQAGGEVAPATEPQTPEQAANRGVA